MKYFKKSDLVAVFAARRYDFFSFIWLFLKNTIAKSLTAAAAVSCSVSYHRLRRGCGNLCRLRYDLGIMFGFLRLLSRRSGRCSLVLKP